MAARLSKINQARMLLQVFWELSSNPRVKERLDEIVFARGYSEPGYDKKVRCVAMGNWNDVGDDKTLDRAYQALERIGVGCEWGDEWAICYGCGKAVRIQADGAFWKPDSGLDAEGNRFCGACIAEDPEPWVHRLDGTTEYLPLALDLQALGYDQLPGDFERGLHYGQDDDPTVIASWLKEQGAKRFIFEMHSADPYTTYFRVWLHVDDECLISAEDWAKAPKVGSSPSQICAEALKNSPLHPGPRGWLVMALDKDTGEVTGAAG